MSLVARLKSVIEGLRGEATNQSDVSVLSAILGTMAMFSLTVSLPAWAGQQLNRCPVDALSALPDQPVVIERVERNGDGGVRVAWPLRVVPEESEVFGAPRQLQTGAQFDVLRCLPPGRWVALGQGEVVGRNGGLVEGQLALAGQAPAVERGVADELVSSGNLYPMPMVGDLVVVRRKEIVQRQAISPRITIAADTLFESSRLDGLQVELSRRGQESLKDLLSRNFADARGKLLIEVHAQRPGSRQKLRQETSQRAENIGRFLRYEFGIGQDQVVAVGHGSDTYVPGFVSADRAADFVVLRMLPEDKNIR